MHSGLTIPDSNEYCLVCDDYIKSSNDDNITLEQIRQLYGINLPQDYIGRAVAPSDVIELYNGDESRFYYCNKENFYPISFSPNDAKIIDFY